MADEAKEGEIISKPAEKIQGTVSETPVPAEGSALVKEPDQEKLAKLESELGEHENKPEQTPVAHVSEPSVSASGAEYGKSYASIAESRFGKGPLAKHGDAAIAESLKFGIPKNASILEIGCNTGMLMEQLTISLKDKAPKIFGVDFNKEAIEIAKQRGFDATFGDAQNLPDIPDSSVDIIYSLHTFEHVPDLSKAFKELQRILKPGGRAYIVIPPNMHGLETVRVAAEDLPEDQKGKGLLSGIKTFVNAWSYARKLHCSNLGGPFGGARKHAEKILNENQINLKVTGGMRLDLALASLLIFEKPTSQVF